MIVVDSASSRIALAGTADLPLITVESKEFRLVFAPTRGGRLLALSRGDTELLWQNPRLIDAELRPAIPVRCWPQGGGGMSTWANVGGSKTWPAPQGWAGRDEWAGPPDGVLDSGVWDAEARESPTGEIEVGLTSPPDQRSGLRVHRDFTVPHAGFSFRQRTTFENTSRHAVRWSIWEVCQIDTGSARYGLPDGVVAVPVFPDTYEERDLGTHYGSLRTRVADDEVLIPLSGAVAKRGYVGARGSVSYRPRRGPGLTITAEPTPGAQYPDGGCNVEVWVQCPTPHPLTDLDGFQPDTHLVELEVLGPLVSLEPGASTSVELIWTITPG